MAASLDDSAPMADECKGLGSDDLEGSATASAATGTGADVPTTDVELGIRALSDVAITVKNVMYPGSCTRYHLHKQQLANSSGYFATMFTGDKTVRHLELPATLGVTPINEETFGALLHFIYNPLLLLGKEHGIASRLQLIQLAHYMDMPQLLKKFVEDIEKQIDSTMDNEMLLSLLALGDTPPIHRSNVQPIALKEAVRRVGIRTLKVSEQQWVELGGSATTYQLYCQAMKPKLSLESSDPYNAGDKIWARWKGQTTFHAARVISVDDAKQQLHVSYDDGDTDRAVPFHKVKHRSA